MTSLLQRKSTVAFVHGVISAFLNLSKLIAGDKSILFVESRISVNFLARTIDEMFVKRRKIMRGMCSNLDTEVIKFVCFDDSGRRVYVCDKLCTSECTNGTLLAAKP